MMRRFLISLSIILLVMITMVFAGNFAKSHFWVRIEQPIQFNHKKHIETVELECLDCHNYYKTQSNSGRPTLDICMGCHEDAQTKNPEEEKIREYAKKNTEIPWKRIYYLPDHVRYSHRLHTQKAKIKCGVCHGDMAAQTSPPTRPLVLQTMEFCIGCHKKSGAPVDCLTCHR